MKIKNPHMNNELQVNSIGGCPSSPNVHIVIHIFNFEFIVMNFHEIQYKNVNVVH
jgi:hypothetical protein